MSGRVNIVSTGSSYHHGNLRQTLLDVTDAVITEAGPAAVSLRELARRAGVSHAAPAHHFADKTGLFTAFAAQGFGLLATTLTQAQERREDFRDMGVAYVGFALAHRAHFEVMYRPDLYHDTDPALQDARDQARNALYTGIGSLGQEQTGPDTRLAGVAAWSLVHGLATLYLTEALPTDLSQDPAAITRAVAEILFTQP